MQTITIPEDTAIQYESLSWATPALTTFDAQVLDESNGFMRCIDPDGDVFHVRTKSLPGRDSSLYPHPDAPCWACKTVAEADAKLKAIKDHHYHTPTRYRDHHALSMAVLRHANTVARLTDTTTNQPACTATEDEVSIDADDSAWMNDSHEIGRTLGIPAPTILPAPSTPAPTERSTQPDTDTSAVAHIPAKTPEHGVSSVDPISKIRIVNDPKDGLSAIIPSFSGGRPYRVRLAWGFDDTPDPIDCTCTHYVRRIAPAVRRSLRANAECAPTCKHMRAVKVALLAGHTDLAPYRLVALAA